MREIVSLEKLQRFLRALGTQAARETVLYLTGGATALVYGWRASTVDVDMKIEPGSDRLLRAIPV